jgi:hypothetical protein
MFVFIAVNPERVSHLLSISLLVAKNDLGLGEDPDPSDPTAKR